MYIFLIFLFSKSARHSGTVPIAASDSTIVSVSKIVIAIACIATIVASITPIIAPEAVSITIICGTSVVCVPGISGSLSLRISLGFSLSFTFFYTNNSISLSSGGGNRCDPGNNGMKTHGCVSKVIDCRSGGNRGGTGYYGTSFIFAYIIGIGNRQNRVSVDKWYTVDMRMAYGVGKSWISFSRSLSHIVAIIGISIPIYPFGFISISWISIITIPGISGSLGFGLRLSHNSGYSESYDKQDLHDFFSCTELCECLYKSPHVLCVD